MSCAGLTVADEWAASFVDVYSIHTAALRHLQRVSIIPPGT